MYRRLHGRLRVRVVQCYQVERASRWSLASLLAVVEIERSPWLQKAISANEVG
jgi:hypothetical protein